jgi:hypothetical protein
MKFPLPVAILVLGAAAPAALADTLRVPSVDYATIQAAVDAAGEGDLILVAAGLHNEDVTVTGKTGLRIRGKAQGATWPTFPPGTSLTISGNSTEISVRGFEFANAPVTVQDCTDVTLTRIRFRDGADAVTTGNTVGCVISKCSFTNFTGTGIVDTDSDGLQVVKCTFEDVDGSCVSLTPVAGTGTMGAILAKNRILNCGAGFDLGGPDAIVEKNRMEGLSSHGILGDGDVDCSGAEISKNRIETSADYGIIAAYSDFSVLKNTLTGGGIQGTGNGHLFLGNRVYAAEAAGIWTSATDCFLYRNTVRGAAADGIRVQGDSGILERNTVYDANDAGFAIIADLCELYRNNSVRADNEGFFIDGSPTLVQQNRASGSGDFDLADTSLAGVNVYTDNKFASTVFGYSP